MEKINVLEPVHYNGGNGCPSRWRTVEFDIHDYAVNGYKIVFGVIRRTLRDNGTCFDTVTINEKAFYPCDNGRCRLVTWDNVPTKKVQALYKKALPFLRCFAK